MISIPSSYKNNFLILTFQCLFNADVLTHFMNNAEADPDATREGLQMVQSLCTVGLPFGSAEQNPAPWTDSLVCWTYRGVAPGHT